MNGKKLLRAPGLWMVVALGIALLFYLASNIGGFSRIDTSQAMTLINSSKVESAKITPDSVSLTLKEKQDIGTLKGVTRVEADYVDARGSQIVNALTAHPPTKGFTDDPQRQGIFVSLLMNLLPILLLVGLFWFFMSQAQGGNSKVMQFGKSKAKLHSKDMPTTKFSDVAGADEAVEELKEIKDFLAEPAKYEKIGAKIPKGVLLYGPPGTGKTLLARAVAGEANVPFYTISGSDFVEMFVGVGASRVRDLFSQAKENAPAIIFVDEIDAVGRHRGAGLGGGHDEREQTLNQLLVEMDGFDDRTRVILIAATNRPDILDPALLRPGRFDRQIAVEAPDMLGRHRILQVHGRSKPLAPDVDLLAVARRTPGMTGADLANVLNEAALLTARSNAQIIDDRALDEAIDRVMAGPQRRSRLMKELERKITAYHEGGHALVAAALRNTDPVTKITILPRGRALGYTMVMPSDDKYSTTRNELLDQMAYAMGGRAAEEIVFHDPSTGASNDIQKATDTARKMVTQYGMSAKIGSVKIGGDNSDPFVGREMGSGSKEYSDRTLAVVDDEVRLLLEQAHDEAHQILLANRAVLDRLALELLEKETLNEAQIQEIFRDVTLRDVRPVWQSGEEREVSDLPPVVTAAEREEARRKNLQDPSTMAPQDQAVGAKPEHPLEVPEHQDPRPGGESGSGQGGEPGQEPGGVRRENR